MGEDPGSSGSRRCGIAGKSSEEALAQWEGALEGSLPNSAPRENEPAPVNLIKGVSPEGQLQRSQCQQQFFHRCLL